MVGKFELKYRKIHIDISVKGFEGIRDLIFIIDTGASYSIVNKKTLKALGYTNKDFFKTERLQGFGGNVKNVNFLKLNSIAFLGLQRNNFEVGITDFKANVFYDGILGLDFFLNHKLCIDFKKGIVELD